MVSGEHPPRRPRPGPWPPAGSTSADVPAAPPPQMSWARKTGFKGRVSGESNASSSSQIALPKLKEAEPNVDLEYGKTHALPTPPTAAVATNAQPAPAPVDPTVRRRSNLDGGGANQGPRSVGPVQNGQHRSDPPAQPKPRREEEALASRHVHEEDNGLTCWQSDLNYKLRDTPGLVPIVLYGIQHYLSIMGSLVLTPLVIVPAMGGTSEDTAAVVSTVLFISGVTTLLHTSFGTRLPLIQGPSFVYLAPALAIINSPEFQGLNANNFKHIMKELQGAFIVSSAFQAILGYSGLMSLLLRLVNPIVVSSTVAAVGLSFFSYGFTQVGNCLEIGIMQILFVIIFSLASTFGTIYFIPQSMKLGFF